MEKITARTNPVYCMPKPWDPQGRTQIEFAIGYLSLMLTDAVATEAYKIFSSLPKKGGEVPKQYNRPETMPANQPLSKPGVNGYENDFICNAEHPMPINTPPKSRWQHVNAVEVDGASDYYAYYECPNCGHRFKCELPE